MEIELPFEVLVYLFKYLPNSDRAAASETCRSWYLAANDKCFLDRKVGVFYKSVLSDETTSPLQIFIDSPTDYCNFFFNEVEISSKLSDFWDIIGERIRSLTLRNCDTCEKVFLYILQKCPNLETLNIQSCRELFMSGGLLEGKTDGLLVDNLDKLKVLSFSDNKYLTDALLNSFISVSPSLEELDLSSCSLQFHRGPVTNYPQTTDMSRNPSESVLTFYFVLQIITSKAKNIKGLFFSGTSIEGTALKTLAEISDLKLDSLNIQYCPEMTNEGILALTSYQTSLKVLNIGCCFRVTDESLVHICKNLVNLQNLNIHHCSAVTDLAIAELNKLKKLRSLDISWCELITKDGLEKGICSEENTILEELHIQGLKIDQSGLIMISEKLPNLKSLDLSYCFNAVTDSSIQVIFRNQVLLHTLKLSHSDKVSDAGLTGMGKMEDNDEEGPIMSSYDGSNTPPRIHLGSRAEEEIVRDAKRKQDVIRMCEKLSMDTGISLARLQNLKELHISDCKRISNVSLTYAFNFKELYILNMSNCQQITHEGIEHLVKTCPSIECLNLSNCYNLKDEAVTKIVVALKRLKELKLEQCSQLTVKTLEAIRDHCKKLKFLDVHDCPNIYPELACTLDSLPTLHTILISKPRPYVPDDIKRCSRCGLQSRAYSDNRDCMSLEFPPEMCDCNVSCDSWEDF